MPPSPARRLADAAKDDWHPPDLVPPDAVRDLPRVIMRQQEAMQPATDREIAVVLGKLAIHYGAQDRPEEHHRMAYEDWLSDLAEFPLVALNEAAREWRRTKPWPPKISEIRALCDTIVDRRRTELARLGYLAWCVEYHNGRCPRLLRRVGERLVDYAEPLTNRVIQAALDGRTEFPGDRVLAVPGVAQSPAPEHLNFSALFPAALPPSAPARPRIEAAPRRKVSGFSRAEIAAGCLDERPLGPPEPPAPAADDPDGPPPSQTEE